MYGPVCGSAPAALVCATGMISAAASAAAVDVSLWNRLTGSPLGLYERAGLWLVLGLSLILAAKILLRWLVAVYATANNERRTITYKFSAHLPVRVTIWWRCKSVDSQLAAILEWDGEKFETRPNESFVRWARPNRLHKASLLLPEEQELDAAQGVKLHVKLWIPLVRRLKWSGEFQLDYIDQTTVAAPISLSPVAVASRDDQGTLEPEQSKAPTPPPPVARQAVKRASSERDLVSIAAEFINSDFPDRSLLRQQLADEGMSPEFYSPTRVQDSANCMFTRFWFKPDAQAGGWLWAETDGAFIAVPFDRSQLTAETMRHYLSSLYQGLGSGFDRRTPLRMQSACWLARGREPNEYVVIKPGQFAGDRAPQASVALSRHGAPNDEKEQRRREGEKDAAVTRIEARLDSFEAKIARLEQGWESDDVGRREIEAVQEELRNVKRSTERDLSDFRARLAHFEDEITSVKTVRIKDEAPAYPHEATPRERLPDQDGRLAFRTDLAVGPADFTPPVPRSSMLVPEPNRGVPASEPAKFSSPSIPAGWKPFVAEGGLAVGIDDYLETLQRAYERLGRSHVGMVKIVHLLESDDHGVYGVHTEDWLDIENDQLVARCAHKPTFRTPPKQFFIALAEPPLESLWILCPPGSYSSLGFDYPTLIDNVPASSFTIAKIITPARLDRRDTALYRVAARMNVTFS